MPRDSTATPGMRRGLVWLFRLAGGLSVANIHYIQPLLDVVAREFEVSAAAAGLLVTLIQLGFVVGLLALVPLGDVLNRRSLATTLLLLTAGAFAVAGAAPTFGVLAAAIVVIGLTSVVAQILVPLAATLAHDAERGQVVGSVMTGVMLGTLCSRTLSGVVADVTGWRSVFWVAAALMLGLAVLLRRQLPDVPSGIAVRYRRLLRSLLDLILHEPVLQRRAAYGALSFGVFSAFWTTIPFLLARAPYGYTEAGIGAVALIGIPSALLAPRAGRLTDRGHGTLLTGASFAVMFAGAAFALLGGRNLAALLIGGLLISVSCGCLHVTNQSLIYRFDSAARGRLTAVYVSSLFAGGMAGSALAATLYAAGGWTAVTVLAATLATFAMIGWLTGLFTTALARSRVRSGQTGGAGVSRSSTLRSTPRAAGARLSGHVLVPLHGARSARAGDSQSIFPLQSVRASDDPQPPNRPTTQGEDWLETSSGSVTGGTDDDRG